MKTRGEVKVHLHHSLLLHYMEGSGQLCAPVALPPGARPVGTQRVGGGGWGGGAPQVWTLWSREKLSRLTLYGDIQIFLYSKTIMILRDMVNMVGRQIPGRDGCRSADARCHQ
jgi:hypothetical protein